MKKAPLKVGALRARVVEDPDFGATIEIVVRDPMENYNPRIELDLDEAKALVGWLSGLTSKRKKVPVKKRCRSP